MPAPLTFPGPVPHDELVSWSTAPLGPEPTGEVLAMGALPWPGQLLHLNGRRDLPGVFVRTTAATAAGASAACFVHGLAGSSTNWTSVAGLLAPLATGYAVDLPGSGRSDPPADGDYSVRRHVQTLSSVLRELSDEPMHLIGNSLGGVLSTHLAAAHPELFRSLTLISPAVPDFRMTRNRGADVRLAALLAPGVGNWAEPQLARVTAEDRVQGLIEVCFGDASQISDQDRAAALAEVAWRRDLPWAQRAVIEEMRGLLKSYLTTGRRSFWGGGSADHRSYAGDLGYQRQVGRRAAGSADSGCLPGLAVAGARWSRTCRSNGGTGADSTGNLRTLG